MDVPLLLAVFSDWAADHWGFVFWPQLALT